ncbi:lipopolysaccharide biosynthesis protein [Pedobacter sp. SD-b]|uniref:Lipopolysaccharide biosynthesis protein n=1 Tax=Pedobacter segetis TaxID=2793069 RepID=A0ABS1BMH2_9SPHI|nr:Wzz/FepE/Etk N-terminal domain-containing protein [Pedobacter segetis]MBK0384090.1 lipopolysaccharide biosynthesis protein [Pedobacter segetis]
MSQSEEHISKHSQKVEFTETFSDERPNAQDEEISLKELILKLQDWWKYLWSKWLTILIAGLIGGALGLTYAFIKKPVYTAETTFVLEEGESGGGLGQYAGLASMVGIDLGGGGGGIFKGDNILELYKSRRMIQETLLAKDTFNGKQQSLIERYIEFNKLREEWEEKPLLKNISFDNPDNFNRTQDSIIGKLVETINNGVLEVAKPDKKLSIIAVTVKSKDELFAKSFADNIVNKVNNFYVNTKTKKSNENVAILQNQADSVKRVLNASIGGVAAAVDANPNLNPALQTLRVNSQRKQVDVQASGAIYEEIVKNLEMAKITLRNDKPLIQVIDEPVFPLKESKPSFIKIPLIFSLIFLFIGVTLLLIRKGIQSLLQ